MTMTMTMTSPPPYLYPDPAKYRVTPFDPVRRSLWYPAPIPAATTATAYATLKHERSYSTRHRHGKAKVSDDATSIDKVGPPPSLPLSILILVYSGTCVRDVGGLFTIRWPLVAQVVLDIRPRCIARLMPCRFGCESTV